MANGPTKRAGTAKKATAKKAVAKQAGTTRTPAKKAVAKQAAPVAPATAVVVDQSPTPASTPAVAAAPTPSRDKAAGRSLAFRVAGGVLVVAALVLLLYLRAQERGGPAHEWVSIGDGIPGTLYVPYEDADDDDDGLPAPPPEDERPPVVVIAHGYSADQNIMSGLARSLAEAGYAALTFDFRGHGSNTQRFQGELRDDLDAVVDWAETSPFVDGDRIAVLGHSMGAGAVLDFATLDARPKAVVPVSGGWIVNDGVVPTHTLFLVASGDPGRIAERQEELAADLEAAGGDVVSKEISGVDHTRILRRDETVQATVEFLDPILGVDRDGPAPGLDDGRMKTAMLYLLVALALTALLGNLAGRAAPAGPATDQPGPAWSGYALVVGALVVTMPVLSQGSWDLLPLGAGQPIVMHLALAGGLLWGLRALAHRGVLTGPIGTWLGDDRPWLSLRTGGWTGLAAAGVIISLLLPLAPVFHRMVPTPQRAVYWVVLAALALPFFAAYHALIRRGGGSRSVIHGVAGRLVLLVVMVLGVLGGALPFVILLVLPLLVLQYVVLELFAANAYLASRSTTLVAVVDAVIVGWLAVTFTPVS